MDTLIQSIVNVAFKYPKRKAVVDRIQMIVDDSAPFQLITTGDVLRQLRAKGLNYPDERVLQSKFNYLVRSQILQFYTDEI